MIRRILFMFFAALPLLAASQNREPRFGATAGYAMIIGSDGLATPDLQPGIHVGASLDIGLCEKWSLVPKVLYASYDGANFLHLPLFAQYKVAERLGIQAGPQLSFLLQEPFGPLNRLGLDIGLGVNYDLLEKIYLNARYAKELTDRLWGNPRGNNGLDTFMFGIGYRF